MGMTINESFDLALKLHDNYSINGTVQVGTQIADYEKKKFDYANLAQVEVSRINKIEATHSFSLSSPTKNALISGFDLVAHKNSDKILMTATGALSYYFENNNVGSNGSYVLEEETSDDVWTELSTTAFDAPNGEFIAYKGIVTASDTENDVRIRIIGDYPSDSRNYVFYNVNYADSTYVPEFAPWIEHDLPENFLMLDRVVREKGEYTQGQTNDYRFSYENNTILTKIDAEGLFEIHYYKKPTKIDDSFDGSELYEVDDLGVVAISYYMAGLMVSQEKPASTNFFFQRFDEILGRLNADENKKPVKVKRVKNSMYGRSE